MEPTEPRPQIPIKPEGITLETKTFSAEWVNEKIKVLLEKYKDEDEVLKKFPSVLVVKIDPADNPLNIPSEPSIVVESRDNYIDITLNLSTARGGTTHPGAIRVNTSGKAFSGKSGDNSFIRYLVKTIADKFLEVIEGLKKEREEIEKMEIINGELVITFSRLQTQAEKGEELVKKITNRVHDHIKESRTNIENSIKVGSIIAYQGVNFEVKELPSEENKNKYILVHTAGKPVYKLTLGELIKIYESGDVVLVMPETKIVKPALETWTPKKEQELQDVERQIAELEGKIAEIERRRKEELENLEARDIDANSYRINAKYDKMIEDLDNEKQPTELKGEEVNPAELPEDVRKFIDGELSILKKDLEIWTKKDDVKMVEYLNNGIKLLESDPVTYFIKKRDSDKKTLQYILNHKRPSGEEQKEEEAVWTKKVEEWQRVIDALEALNPKKQE